MEKLGHRFGNDGVQNLQKRHMENGDADMPFTGFLDLV